MKKEFMYVGCFTDIKRAGTGDGGIFVYQKQKDGNWELIQTMKQENPSYICFDENKENLYAIQAASTKIHSYKINQETGKLSYMNTAEAVPSNFCCVYDRKLFVSGREVSIYDLNDDGSIKERSLHFTPYGEVGPLSNKQHSVSSHQFAWDPKHEYFALPLHGADRIDVYKYKKDTNEAILVSTLPTQYAMLPRHIAFHKEKPYAYLLIEHIGEVESFKYENGTLTPFQIQLTFPEDYVGLRNTTAEIEIHPNGKHLVLTNRGHNSMLLMRILDDGKLEKVSWFTDGVDVSRYFCFDKNGEHIYLANIGKPGNSNDIYASELNTIPNTGSIVIYKFNEQDETIIKEQIIECAAPSCIIFKDI